MEEYPSHTYKFAILAVEIFKQGLRIIVGRNVCHRRTNINCLSDVASWGGGGGVKEVLIFTEDFVFSQFSL